MSPTNQIGFSGTNARQLGSITLCRMDSDCRDCLDAAMEGWKKYKAAMPKRLWGKQYRPGVYDFAYWLIRWSKLVIPARSNKQGRGPHDSRISNESYPANTEWELEWVSGKADDPQHYVRVVTGGSLLSAIAKAGRKNMFGEGGAELIRVELKP